jgi:hydrogenase nickel incorporation protein HypA/HybF
MHEVSLMTETVRLATEAARDSGATRVTGLKLRIGTLAGVVPEAMQFAWDVVTDETMAKGARLEIEIVPATGWCPACQAEYACADFLNECPGCHATGGELRHGRELEIASVETD